MVATCGPCSSQKEQQVVVVVAGGEADLVVVVVGREGERLPTSSDDGRDLK
jgi:hypothetical protein